MGRIEEALRKLEQQRGLLRNSGGQRQTPARTDSLPSKDFASFSLDAVSQRVPADRAALRRWGPVSMLGDEESVRREYGQIKRPILDAALGRSVERAPNGNVVQITSAIAGEGKSITALNLALSAARGKDWTVLLVDADTAKPDISRALGVGQKPGLTNLIADDKVQMSDVVWGTFVDRLYFMPAGTERGSASELLGSRRMARIVEILDRDMANTLVVVDSSPLLLTNESPMIAALAGQIVVVVRANSTPRMVVGEALELIDPSKPVGFVLNRLPGPELGAYATVYGEGIDEETQGAVGHDVSG